ARADDREQQQEGRRRAGAALARYAAHDPAWRDRPAVRNLPEPDREALPGEVGELLLLLAGAGGEEALALNDPAPACFTPEPAPRARGGPGAGRGGGLGRRDEAAALRGRAKRSPPRGATDCYLLALAAARAGEPARAIPLLRRAVEDDPEHFAAWFLLGNCCL